MSETCGCCDGIGRVTPEPTTNRPGLGALRYRVGTHATFLESMIAALTLGRDRGLDTLTARAPDDPSLALLDAWATIADVLTFYQERIANEGYLRTATERRSILELGRLVGYELRPGVAASVYLAYTLETGYEVEIPAGARAQSLPGPGELPPSFETSAPLPARAEWNALEPRKTRPLVITQPGPRPRIARIEDAATVPVLYLAGTSANLKANDRILLAFGPVDAHPRVVASSEPQPAANRTKVTLLDEPTNPLPTEANRGDGTNLRSVVEALKKEPEADQVRPLTPAHLNRRVQNSFADKTDAGASLVAKSDPLLADTFYRALENARLTQALELTSVDALRVKAPLFGHNAPLKTVLNAQGGVERTEEWPLETVVTTLRVQLSPIVGGDFTRVAAVANSAPVLHASIRRGVVAAQAEQALPSDTSTMRVDGVELTLERTNTGITIVIVPATDNQFRMSGRTEYRFSSGASDSDRSNLGTIRVVGTDETGAQGGRNIAVGETGRFSVGRRRVTVEFPGDSVTLVEETPVAPSAADLTKDGLVIALDATYDQIIRGSRVLIERLRADGSKMPPVVTRVTDSTTLTKTQFGMTAKVTQLTLEHSWLDADWLAGHQHSLSAHRNTTLYAHSDPQQLIDEPITDPVGDGRIELQGLYHGLESGRWLIVSGERADIPETDGVQARELVMLAKVEQDVERVEIDGDLVPLEGSKTRSTIVLANSLAYTYKRDTVKIYGNVVKATHGETRVEILGSGDGSKTFQEFTLKQPPLTYVAAVNPTGAESTLEVRVNEVKWHHVRALFDAGPDERCYTTRTNDAGQTTVVFGDGVHGARLPTGAQNVTAVYRNGIGKSGNARKDQISLLVTRPLGVKEVINPLAASGGGEPESRDDARGNVPLALLALDRLVSVPDYEAFTRAFAGIGKASATRLSDGRAEHVHLTIAGADDIPIDSSSDLYRHLVLALRELGDPQLPVIVESRTLLFLIISATVTLMPDYHWQDVERRLRAALLDAFSFRRRQLGQDVVLSEVISVMHAVAGVASVDVDVLDAVSGTTPNELKDAVAATRPKPRVVAELARARKQPAQIIVLTPDVPDTLILRGPEK
jgi:predicted phage baseplate assembly protein